PIKKWRMPSESPSAPCGRGFIAPEKCCNRSCVAWPRTMGSSRRKPSLRGAVERQHPVAKRTAHRETLTALPHDDQRTRVPPLDFLDPIDVYDRRAVNTNEARGIEPFLQATHALVQQMPGPHTNVQSDVVVRRLYPSKVGGLYDDDSAVGIDQQTI